MQPWFNRVCAKAILDCNAQCAQYRITRYNKLKMYQHNHILMNKLNTHTSFIRCYHIMQGLFVCRFFWLSKQANIFLPDYFQYSTHHISNHIFRRLSCNNPSPFLYWQWYKMQNISKWATNFAHEQKKYAFAMNLSLMC